MTTSAISLRQVVLDTTDVRALAEFYRGVLGYDYRPGDEPPDGGVADKDWLVLRAPDGGVSVAFQQVDELPVVTWPEGEHPQMLHLDLSVASAEVLRDERQRLLALGARELLDRFDDPDEPLYVFADPSGHPFCVFVAPRPAPG